MDSNKQLHKPKETKNVSPKQLAPHPKPLTWDAHPAAIIHAARADPKSLTQADVLQLHRTIGNRAVGQLMSEIGRIPYHSAEQEPVQRQGPEEEEAPPNKTGMPDHLKLGIENISGMDLSGVRVHYNSSKPKQVNALAYTQGQKIHVAPGQEKHLPHEGWHVVQQMQGRVQPTMQMKGVSINDDAGLEREADVMGRKALQMKTETSQECKSDNDPYKKAPEKAQIRQSEVRNNYKDNHDERLPIQRYIVGKNRINDILYNISFGGKLICGIEYPNHELYVLNPAILTTLNESVSEGFLEFQNTGTVSFSWDGQNNVDYYRVYPRYKQDKRVGEHNAKAVGEIYKDVRGEAREQSKCSIPSNEDHIINSTHKNNETIRKLLVQWVYNFGHNENIVRLKDEYVPVYGLVYEFLDGVVEKDKALKGLRIFKMVLESIVPNVFDSLSTLLFEMDDRIDTLIADLGNIESSDTYKRKLAYLRDQETSTQNQMDNLLLPRGCDLVSGTVMGNKTDKDEDTQVQNLNFNVLDNEAHHYATKILNDGLDFVTIEGFAKKGHTYFDNTWEFIMHGSYLTMEEAFGHYTEIRYSFFEDFQDGEIESNTGKNVGLKYNDMLAKGMHNQLGNKKKS